MSRCNKGFILSNHRWTVYILAVLVFALLPLTVLAYDFQECNDCHAETLARDAARKYLHSPFAEKQCEECHAAKESAISGVKNLQVQQRISWLADSAVLDTSHGFLLRGDKVADTLVVDLQETGGGFSRREIAVPPLADLAEVEDSGKPPVISEVQVLKVQRGVLLSATIGWRTDTLANASVRYGNQDLLQTVEPGSRLGRRHEVVLSNLKPDRIYRYVAVANDLFGRSQTSAAAEFSTSTPYVIPLPPATSGNSLEVGEEAGLDSSFQRFGTDYLLELTLAQPAAVYIGSREGARQQDFSAESTRAMGTDDDYHAGLNSREVISIEACLNCHSAHLHPVKVSPKTGITIPPEYPTLPDGRITCSSCHAPHGSDYIYLTRKEWHHDLCVGCHPQEKTKS